MSSRLAVVLLALSFLFALPAHGQQPHWLLGDWSGEMSNVSAASRLGVGRTLSVTSVSPDGATAQGTWANAAGKLPVSIAIAGEAISFTTPGSAGAAYKLTHKAGTLAGRWETVGAGGASGSVSLQKK